MSPFFARRIVVFAALTALALGVASRPALLERWHLWRLGSEDLAARTRAAAKLGEMASLRALPRLLEAGRGGNLFIRC